MPTTASSIDAAPPQHDILYGDPQHYSAHPHLAVAADGTWLLVFTQAPRRSVVLHPPLDPAFRNMLMRSNDEGRTWSAPEPVPGADWHGMECAGLTALPDGSVLLNQWQFDWVPPGNLSAGEEDGFIARPEELLRQQMASAEFAGVDTSAVTETMAELFPMARRGGRCWIHRAADGRASFGKSIEVDTRPYCGGYGMRGGQVLPNGDILLPLCDVPLYRAVFMVRSQDNGRSWRVAAPVAAAPGSEFEEPAPVLLPDDRIFMLLRENRSRILHSVYSDDLGETWSAPGTTGIADYPADLQVLQDGRLVLVAGRRRPPYGIALYVSRTNGADWQAPLMIRVDLPNRDLGYPTLAQRADGELVVIYYGRDAKGTTSILSTNIAIAQLRI